MSPVWRIARQAVESDRSIAYFLNNFDVIDLQHWTSSRNAGIIAPTFTNSTTAQHEDIMTQYVDENIFMVYGFEKDGKEDPAEIAQAGISNNAIMKCPVIAADAAMAVELFQEAYPLLMIAGIVNLADMKQEIMALEEFKASNES